MLFELIRRQEAQLVSGIDAESSWFKFVKEGFQPSGVNVSTNTVRYIKSEIETVKAARIAGYSDIQIKELVSTLEKNRLLNAKEMLEALK